MSNLFIETINIKSVIPNQLDEGNIDWVGNAPNPFLHNKSPTDFAHSVVKKNKNKIEDGLDLLLLIYFGNCHQIQNIIAFKERCGSPTPYL